MNTNKQSNWDIAEEANKIEKEMKAIGRLDLARRARKLYLAASRAALAEYYAGGVGAKVLDDYRAGRFVVLQARG